MCVCVCVCVCVRARACVCVCTGMTGHSELSTDTENKILFPVKSKRPALVSTKHHVGDCKPVHGIVFVVCKHVQNIMLVICNLVQDIMLVVCSKHYKTAGYI